MPQMEAVLRPARNIRGGVRPEHYKNTAERMTVKMPSPTQVTITMQQHIGGSCKPCVKVGDTVYVGTKIGDSDKFISAPIHSSVSGEVTKITKIMLPNGQVCDAVVIDSDGFMTPDPEIAPVNVETAADLIKAVRNSGLVGLGGAGFPAHVKLNIPEDKKIDTLIINGAECEPYITSDYRECIESPKDILQGVYLLKKLMGFKKVIIAVESNKPKAIKILHKIASDKQDSDNSVRLMKLKSHYPQGAEKVLIYTATGRKLPLGKLPADVGCIVMNITSVAFINKYIQTGMPLVSKRITVDGDAVATPTNVEVPIGTAIKDVLEFCGGLKYSAAKILMGGPMMGLAMLSAETPVLKQNNAILVFSRRKATPPPITPCIRCGRCIAACPMKLMPAGIEVAMKKPDADTLGKMGVNYCIECGSCAFSCPAKRPLVQVMKLAKAQCRKNK